MALVPHPGPSIDTLSSVGEHGARNFLHPAQARGRFTRLRRVVFALLVFILVALPFVRIRGLPGIWLDIGHRSFHILGMSVGPTESYLLFFLITGTGFALVVVSALWGRVWCGWACPQTVFLEGVYRRIEHLFEGDRPRQLKLDAMAWSEPEKILRRGGKNAVFVLLSLAIAHLLLCYFVPAPQLWALIRQGPRQDPEVFIWAAALTAVTYFNFAWFREQFCIILCPYGRLQSILSDSHTVVVGYDAGRGEPRGRLGHVAGDCIDCLRCVAVCPTGIDIRQGMQLECVGCAACIDACDEVMVKIGRPKGLVRYDTEKGFAGELRRFFRPRVYLYVVLGVAGLAALVASASLRASIPVNLLRQTGAPFVLDGGQVRNAYLLRMANKATSDAVLDLEVEAPPQATVTLPQKRWTVPAGEQGVLPLFVALPRAQFTAPFDLRVEVRDQEGHTAELKAKFLGPEL